MTPTSLSFAIPRLLRQLRAISLHTTLAIAFAVTLTLAVTAHHIATASTRAIPLLQTAAITTGHDARPRASKLAQDADHIAQSRITSASTNNRNLPAIDATEPRQINTATRQDSTNPDSTNPASTIQASTNHKLPHAILDQLTIASHALDQSNPTVANNSNAPPIARSKTIYFASSSGQHPLSATSKPSASAQQPTPSNGYH